MTRTAVFLALCLLVSVSTSARSEVLHVTGTLQGDPIPDGFSYELSVLALPSEGFRLEVVAKNCSGRVQRNARGTLVQDILFPAERGCQRVTALFGLPAVLFNVGGNVFYRSGSWNLKIGDVIGVGSTRWVRLRKGATIEATVKSARLALDTVKLSQPGRAGLFEKLHGAP